MLILLWNVDGCSEIRMRISIASFRNSISKNKNGHQLNSRINLVIPYRAHASYGQFASTVLYSRIMTEFVYGTITDKGNAKL